MAYSQGSSRLKYWLDVRGMTQTELSRRSGWTEDDPEIGWSPRMISYFCSGDRSMPPEALYTFAKILGVQMEDLNNWPEQQSK